MRKGLLLIISIISALLLTSLLSFGLKIQTANAEPYFNDNFNDGVADGWTEQLGSWHVTNGEYRVSVGIVENGISTVNGMYLTDCIIETQLRFTDSVGYRTGIVFRYTDASHYYSFEIGNEYDEIDIIKYSPANSGYGEDRAFIQPSFGNSSIVINANVNYTLRIEAQGSIFNAYLDGQKVLSWSDTSYSNGLVGLRARRADVNFDYFKIENAIIQPSPSLAPSASPSGSPTSSVLIADWKFNEGSGSVASDSSGNNYHGTIHGAIWVGSQDNYALKLNGVSDYVDVPSLPVSDISSLSVVAWINSDLTKTGYILYHGNPGEFLLHNGERLSDGPVSGRYPNLASFSVKLAGSTWYDVYSSPLEPNTWHQIVGVWTKGVVLKIYVDGVLAGENNAISSGYLLSPGSSWRPSLGVYNRGAGADDYFRGVLDNVMVYSRALSAEEIGALYANTATVSVPTPTPTPSLTPTPSYTPEPTPAPKPTPSLNLTCKSSASYSSFKVEIIGSLTDNGTGLSGSPILVSYSVDVGNSWNQLTSVNTKDDGSFSAVWFPSVTGNYLVKATYSGSAQYSQATTIVNFAVTPYEEESVFSVTSNSTLTELSFNSTSKQLSFGVSGASGTTGYVNAYIPKSLMNDVSDLKVYLDENQISYTTESQSDYWLLHFTYQHSAHKVTITLNTLITQPNENLLGNWMFYGVLVAVVIIITVAVVLAVKRIKAKKQKPP